MVERCKKHRNLKQRVKNKKKLKIKNKKPCGKSSNRPMRSYARSLRSQPLRMTDLKGMEKLQTKATLRKLRVAPRKVRLLIDLIRGMQVDEAVAQLEISKKDASRSVLKLLKSAIANAKHNHQLKEETLVIKIAYVDGGETLHRWTPRAMGRATPIRKRTSHITLILEGEVDEKAAKKVKKQDNKVEKNVRETKEEKKVEKKEDKKGDKDKTEEIHGEKVGGKK